MAKLRVFSYLFIQKPVLYWQIRNQKTILLIIWPMTGKLQFPPGESPCVSHMAIYAGNCLAECSAPAAPLSRFPSKSIWAIPYFPNQNSSLQCCSGLAARSVEVIRVGDRTVGVTLTLEPNFGEIGRTSFPVKTQSAEFIKVSILKSLVFRMFIYVSLSLL